MGTVRVGAGASLGVPLTPPGAAPTQLLRRRLQSPGPAGTRLCHAWHLSCTVAMLLVCREAGKGEGL